MFGFSAFAEAPFASLVAVNQSASVNAFATVSVNGVMQRVGAAQINALASVSVSAIRQRVGVADINALASVSASSNAIFSGFGSVNAVTLVNCYANANYSARGSIANTATVVANSFSNAWDNIAVGANTWTETNNNLYVFNGYWNDGYVDGFLGWTDAIVNSNTWYRQG